MQNDDGESPCLVRTYRYVHVNHEWQWAICHWQLRSSDLNDAELGSDVNLKALRTCHIRMYLKIGSRDT